MEVSWMLPLRVNILQKDPLVRTPVTGNESGAGKKLLYLDWILKNLAILLYLIFSQLHAIYVKTSLILLCMDYTIDLRL